MSIKTNPPKKVQRQEEDVATFILSRIQEKEEEFGVRFLGAGVKDVILPGEMIGAIELSY